MVAKPGLRADEELPGLRHLILRRTQADPWARAEEIEALLQYLPSLRSLDLRQGIRPTDELLLEHLPDPASLQNLRVSGDQLRELSRLAPFVNLLRVDIGWTVFDELASLNNCEHLRILSVKGGSDLRGLRALTALERFSIEDPARVSSFRGLDWPSIQSINLCGGSVKGISEIGQFETLRRLVLAVTGVRDLTPLTSARSLVELKIDHGSAELDLTPISSLGGLESLSLLQRSGGTWLERMNFLKGTPHLKTLEVSTPGTIDIESIAALEHLERLRVAAPSGQWIEKLESLDPRIDVRVRTFDLPAGTLEDADGIAVYFFRGDWIVNWRARSGAPRPDSLEMYIMGMLRDGDAELFDRVEFDSESEMFTAVASTESDALQLGEIAREFLRAQVRLG